MSVDVVVDPPLNNVEGVRYEVSQKIEKILRKGRRYFGSSGAAMTHQAYDKEFRSAHQISAPKAVEFLEGERDTTKFLKNWIKDKPNAVLIESVKVPDWEEDVPETADEDAGILDEPDTDHVLLLGNEIILIDSKRWKKKKTYSIDDDSSALMSNHEFEYSDILLNKTIHNWLDYLDEDACLTGLVVINQEDTTVIRNRNWFVQTFRLVELSRFEELLNDKWEQIDEENKEHINTTLVSQIAVRCIKPYDPRAAVLDMNHLRGFQ